jgi:protein-tyrosine phosphatase
MMKYSLSFAVLAILTCYLAVSQGGLWYLLLWFAISFFALAAGYAGVGASIFSKRPDGTIPLWAKIIHFPFLAYTEAVWHATRLLSRENPSDKVEADLILGRRVLAGELPDGIVNCVDLTAEFEETAEIRESTNYISLPILDAGVPTSQDLAKALSQLKEGATYVHCAQGHGRSGMVILAMLHARGSVASFEEGISVLTKARPGVRLNNAQESFTKKFIAKTDG